MADSTEQEVASAPQTAPVAVQAVEVPTFLAYLRRVVPVLLDDDDPDVKALQAAVADKQHLEAIKKFLSDPQTPSLIVQRSSLKGMH